MHSHPNHSNTLTTDPIPVYIERSLNLETGRGYALKPAGKCHTLIQLKDGCQPIARDVVAMNRVSGGVKSAFEEHVKVAIKLAPVYGHPLEDVDVVLAAIPKRHYYEHFGS